MIFRADVTHVVKRCVQQQPHNVECIVSSAVAIIFFLIMRDAVLRSFRDRSRSYSGNLRLRFESEAEWLKRFDKQEADPRLEIATLEKDEREFRAQQQ